MGGLNTTGFPMNADDLAWARQKRYRERRKAAGFRITQPDLGAVLASESRFVAHYERGPECWEWTGARAPKGYGVFGVGEAKTRAHRVAWILSHRTPIPAGMFVMHRCDNPPCVRPDHLFLGTPKENMDDMHAKGRHPNDRGDFSRFVRGEDHHSSKLTQRDVEDIRFFSALGWSQRKLAREFGVSQRAIWAVIHRKVWAHV